MTSSRSGPGRPTTTVPVNGHALRAFRDARGLSLRQLALQVGTSAGHLARIENAERGASPGLLTALADELVVPEHALRAHVPHDEPAQQEAA